MCGVFSDEDDAEDELWSWGWTHPSVSVHDCLRSWESSDSECDPGAMSRRSLRIDDSLLDRSLPHSAASFSLGGATAGRKSRAVSSRRLSSTCSESLLLHTPRKAAPVCGSLSGSLVNSSLVNSSLVNSSGVHSVAASDASLLSSLLDESSIQESTAVDSFWGLDLDVDPKESTVLCESTILADCSVIGPDTSSLKSHSALIGREPVCLKHSKAQSDSDHTSSLSCSSDPLRPQSGPQSGPEPGPQIVPQTETGTEPGTDPGVQSPEQTPTIYCRGRKHKGRLCVGAMKEVGPRERRGNGAAPGGAAATAVRWVRRKWSQMNKDENRRFPPGFVLLLVLLFALIFCGLWCGLSFISMSQFVESELPFLQRLTSESEPPGPAEDQSTKPDSEPGSEEHLTRSEGVQTEEEQPAEDQEGSDLDSSRLERLEQSLSLLWKQLETGAQRPSSDPVAPDDDSDSVLEQQLDLIKTRLEQDRRLWDQVREREEQQQQSQILRLEQIEQQLNDLSSRTLDLEMKKAAAQKHSPDSVLAPPGSEAESQHVLFSELSRLQGALQSVRQELQTLSGCRGTCSQLQDLQQTVSALVQEQLWTLVFGSQVWSALDSVSKPLVQVMSERFVSEQSLQGALSALERRILKEEESEEELPPAGGAVTHQEVHSIVTKALRRFSEDRTGLADFALESGGGSVVSTRCSETFSTKAALLSLFGIPLWYYSQSPRTVIQPDVNPGNCWAFRGSRGVFVIRLSSRILPSGFSLEHVPKALSPTGNSRSAPKDFSVYGLSAEDEEEGVLLGTFQYEEDGDALQTFSVTEENHESFQFILVQVSSNWGHEEYTCVYRFRVHGTPSEDETGDETETQTETEEEAETETQTETEEEAETETQTQTETEEEAETETRAEPQTEEEAETEAETGTEEETEAEEENQTETEAETEAETRTEAEEESKTATQTGTEEETEAETEEEAETRPGSETETGSGPGLDQDKDQDQEQTQEDDETQD